MPFLALLVLLPLALVALMPLVLIQRYRAGRARRLARPWLATVNSIAMIVSAAFFLLMASVAGVWVPNAFSSAILGLAVGGVLGVIGLWLSRWEATPRTLHYTPNSWLVLAITLVVAARILYGLIRTWLAIDSADAEVSGLLATFGIGGSLAAGGTVLGYYVAYAIGVRWRISLWQKRRLRVMN